MTRANWGVDIPGATERQAEALAAHAREAWGLPATAINPAHFYSMSMDAHTVRAILAGVMSADLGPDYRVEMSGMVEEFQEWLNGLDSPPQD